MLPKIEKGIPIPPKTPGKKPKTDLRKTIELLEVGDSFLYQGDKTRGCVSGIIVGAANALKCKFVTRAVDGGVRIWRTE